MSKKKSKNLVNRLVKLFYRIAIKIKKLIVFVFGGLILDEKEIVKQTLNLIVENPYYWNKYEQAKQFHFWKNKKILKILKRSFYRNSGKFEAKMFDYLFETDDFTIGQLIKFAEKNKIKHDKAIQKIEETLKQIKIKVNKLRDKIEKAEKKFEKEKLSNKMQKISHKKVKTIGKAINEIWTNKLKSLTLNIHIIEMQLRDIDVHYKKYDVDI